MELQQFIDNHFEDGEVYSDDESIKFARVAYEEETYHKTVNTTQVFHLLGTDEYFEASTDRDNCGYWSDGERYDPEFRKVKPREVIKTIIEWDGV